MEESEKRAKLQDCLEKIEFKTSNRDYPSVSAQFAIVL